MRRATRVVTSTVFLMLAAHAAPPRASAADPIRTTSPANALVMPFDGTHGTTLLLVTNIAGVSPGPLQGVTSNWSFYSEAGTHLVSISVCLPLAVTVTRDLRHLQSLDVGQNGLGPSTDLSGQRGLVVVTAYATDEVCNVATPATPLVDNALVGSFQIRDRSLRYGTSAFGFAVAAGGFTDVPDLGARPQLWLQSLDPAGYGRSRVVLLGVSEHGGWGPLGSKELGPFATPFRLRATYYDKFALTFSLPEVEIAGAASFTTMKPGKRGASIVPRTVDLNSAGVLRLSFSDLVPVGTRMVLGLHAQQREGHGGVALGVPQRP